MIALDFHALPFTFHHDFMAVSPPFEKSENANTERGSPS